MIQINNFEVGQADCILIHFEKSVEMSDLGGNVLIEKKYFNLLIDGAYKKSKIENKLNETLGEEQIQGIVVTHIDEDHISGILGLVEKQMNKIENAFLLFNKYDESLISYNQGKELAKQFQKKFASNLQIKSYETEFSQELLDHMNCDPTILPIEIMSLEQRTLAEEIDQEIINITILGPTRDNIKKFMQNWDDNIKEGEITNRASIVLLIEYEGKTIVLSGDGYYIDIKSALSDIRNLEKIDVMKAAHHGALDNNIALVELTEQFHCNHIFFTIDESEYQKKKEHPDTKLLKELKKLADEREGPLVLSCNTELGKSDLNQYMIKKNKINIGGEK